MARKSEKPEHPVVASAIELAGGQEPLAEMTGYSQSQVSRMLLYDNKISGEFAIKLEALWPDKFKAAEIVGVELNREPQKESQAAGC
jgi:hypothetical protein